MSVLPRLKRGSRGWRRLPDKLSAEPATESAAALTPDPTQVAAAEHRDSAFQLQAGPGTGKTRTLVRRIESLLAEGVDPTTILVLTFSNKAANEQPDGGCGNVDRYVPRLRPRYSSSLSRQVGASARSTPD
ncbi:MAG: hypothetical protein B7Z52_00260 [Burkholderiales bacterium 12-64-5]|nr:MAG: hypothetical protein B7Z52_00260 [Burkholderiales bacterium 12-64-5]